MKLVLETPLAYQQVLFRTQLLLPEIASHGQSDLRGNMRITVLGFETIDLVVQA